MTRATELAPTNIEAWLWRAGIADDLADTIMCLKHVLAIDPRHVQAKAGLEWAIGQQRGLSVANSAGDAPAALELVEQAQDALRVDNFPAAYKLLVQATELDPLNESAWFWRGSTAPNTDEGMACMEQTLRVNPSHPAAKDALWYLRIKKYRELFAIRTAEPLALDDPLPDLALDMPAPIRNPLKIILPIVAGIVLLFIALAIAVLWRLSM